MVKRTLLFILASMAGIVFVGAYLAGVSDAFVKGLSGSPRPENIVYGAVILPLIILGVLSKLDNYASHKLD